MSLSRLGTALLACLPLFAQAASAGSVSGTVIGPDGKGIAQAVVFVNWPEDSAAGGAPRRTEMDQINKTFVPGVLPVPVGTEVSFPNHDQIHHHVYSFSRTKSFELPLYKGRDAPPVLFDRPGVVKIGCNIHDWMSAVILVLPTRHFAVTDAQGRFTLTDLPEGKYQLVAWHERSRVKLEDTVQNVIVGAADAGATGTPAEVQLASRKDALTFALDLAPQRARPGFHGSRKDP